MKANYPTLVVSLVGFLDLILQNFFHIQLPGNTADLTTQVIAFVLVVFGIFKNHFQKPASAPPSTPASK